MKTIAEKKGASATFMPKPFWGMNGSGSHYHQSMFDLKNGRNLFGDRDSETGLSKMAFQYVAGILSHARAMSMVVAPIVNSYKRLVPHYEAPVYIAWGLGNRSRDSPRAPLPRRQGQGQPHRVQAPRPELQPLPSHDRDAQGPASTA